MKPDKKKGIKCFHLEFLIINIKHKKKTITDPRLHQAPQ